MNDQPGTVSQSPRTGRSGVRGKPQSERALPEDQGENAKPGLSESRALPESGEDVGGRGDQNDRALQATPLGVTPEQLAPTIEGVLLSLDKPMTAGRLAVGLGLAKADQNGESQRPAPAVIRSAIDILNADYERTGRSFRIEQVAGGYRFMTVPGIAAAVAAFHGRRERHTLSRAAVETLAIIAYKQPMTRATLEAIRGVACGEVLRSLLERRLVTVVGRAEELGRPMLYGTTKGFLEAFGLASIKDLPSVADLRPPPDSEEPAHAPSRAHSETESGEATGR